MGFGSASFLFLQNPICNHGSGVIPVGKRDHSGSLVRVIPIGRNGFDGFRAFIGLGMLTSSTRKAFPAPCSQSSRSCNFPALSTSGVFVRLDVSREMKHSGVQELQKLDSPSMTEGFAWEMQIRQCQNCQHSSGCGSTGGPGVHLGDLIFGKNQDF